MLKGRFREAAKGSAGFRYRTGAGVRGTRGVDPGLEPSVVTDKLDYPPGEIALLLGRGWAAQEAVRLELSEDPLVHPAEVLHGLADDVGSFTAGYVVDNHDPGQFYYNVVYTGAGATTVGLVLPYPFVTQGATSVHVYSGVTSAVTGGSLCFRRRPRSRTRRRR